MKLVKITALIFSFSVSNILAATIDDSIVQVDQIVAGQAVGEYVNTWWQWAYSMPPELSPVNDYTGKHCHVGQSGNVWFLAGGYGSSTINRICDIPADKYIFFPIINMVYYPQQPGTLTCDTAKSRAALNNDRLVNIYVELDGMQSWNPASTRMASPKCFDLLQRVPRKFDPPKIYPSASDGYWVMLKPLSKGKHTLTFQAAYGREDAAFGNMQQDIVYELNVQ